MEWCHAAGPGASWIQSAHHAPPRPRPRHEHDHHPARLPERHRARGRWGIRPRPPSSRARRGAGAGRAVSSGAHRVAGSHAGSFEALHPCGTEFTGRRRHAGGHGRGMRPGGRRRGISGLASLLPRQARPDARILLLDNHDDFGGHAKRNEFTHDGLHLHRLRRHAVDRQPGAAQHRREGARHRTRHRCRRLREGPRRGTLQVARAAVRHLLRQGDLRPRPAGRRRCPRAGLPRGGAVHGRREARPGATARRGEGPDAGPLVSREEGAPGAHELHDVRHRPPEARRRRAVALPDPHARVVRRRRGRRPGTGRLRPRPAGVPGHGPRRCPGARPESRLDPPRVGRGLLLPLPRRQRLDCPPPRAAPDPRCLARQDRGRCRRRGPTRPADRRAPVRLRAVR